MALPYRWLALFFRIGAVIMTATGIIRVAGLFTPNPSWSSFLFYTLISNVLCLVWMACSAVRTARDIRTRGAIGTSTPSARGAALVMMAITVTMLIYLIVLVPSTFNQPGTGFVPFTLTDNLIHIFTPVALIVDWLLFIPKGHVRPGDPLRWTLLPYAYLIFAFTIGALGVRFGGDLRYPYPFMDVEKNGLIGVIIWIIALSVSLIAVGYVYFAIDKALGWVATRRRSPQNGDSVVL